MTDSPAPEPVSGPDSAPEPVPGPSSPVEPTPDQLAERQQRANRATRGVLAALLCLEALVVLLVPRAIAQTSTGLDTTKTVLLIVLAVVLVLTAGSLRRPWGIGTGSVLQIVVLACGLLTTVMVVMGAIFIALWLWVLTMRRDLAGRPGGARMLIS